MIVSREIQTQRSRVEGKGLMTRPTSSMKVGRPREARSACACSGLDLRPAPLRREGGKERRRLPHREVWRAAQGDPDMEAAAGIQPPWPRPPDAHTSPDPGLLLQPVPTTLLPAPNPEPGILPSPARGTQDSRLSRGAPAPGPPGRIPSSQNAHALPSPTARPSRSSQNPRPSRPLPGPHP